MFFHIVCDVSFVLLKANMALFVKSRFLLVVGRSLGVIPLCIPLYAIACVIVAILAPWRLNSAGTFSESISGSCFLAPCFANKLLSSFPLSPLCPLVHWKVVGAVRLFRR
jgi:hypothetical protein